MVIEVRDGVAVVDGVPRVLVTADYPYYRDDPAVWADRLRAVRDGLGIEVITCYLPWRHHQPEAGTAPDFTGLTHPSRDVIGFLALCHELGLRVVAKPGPFIHAEVNYGGLPDWVCPDADPAFEALLDASGAPSRWADAATPGGRPLPAPLAPAFLARAGEWLSAVGKEVLDGAEAVIALQIANEGVYTSGALPLTAYDYSASGLAFYRDRLRAWYGTPQAYDAVHGTSHGAWDRIDPPTAAAGPLAQADWGRCHAEYLAEVYRVWTQAVGSDLPVLVNLNPPTVPELDDWLARVRPELWGEISYGFTNWMGVVSADRDAHARYVIAAKRAPGPNLEENWGFSELYDPAYIDGATSFHQSLLALAAGATGFNVYTGVATSGWAPELDAAGAGPYPDCPPIDARGAATAKAPLVRALAGFFAVHGAEFLECEPARRDAFGLYLPYAGIAALSGPDGPGCGRALLAFHERMRARGLDYGLVDLESVRPEELAAYRSVTVPGGPFMHRRVQELLAAYARAGGLVLVDGPVPALDERLAPCALITPSAPPPAAEESLVLYGEADAFLRSHPDRDVHYLVVLVQSGNEGPIGLRTPYGTVEVVAAQGGGAVLRLAGGQVGDLVIRGLNGYLDCAVEGGVRLNGVRTGAVGPGDLVRINGRLV
ncbi:beta-galactosidase [Nonomuraea gerenzanensis]|uniref:Beta-galactosidase n=1 Tax=Nonomuraea gerenzanensis TaxID=93944 RepID=A0A1M4EHG6_9ACTN|nr:beta-galactosidase [Nonomuraea gerenzanensis]UBU09954.1 beta-galactosidase [Nonomuraea gerenzanensis]SBO98407.1 Beta-galactosidase [Nonomuraea gerenzanensis]